MLSSALSWMRRRGEGSAEDGGGTTNRKPDVLVAQMVEHRNGGLSQADGVRPGQDRVRQRRSWVVDTWL